MIEMIMLMIIGIVPDVQNYMDENPNSLNQQIEWLNNNTDYIIFLGDMVNNPKNNSQWNFVNKHINNLTKPYSITVGNHDYCYNNYSMFNKHYPQDLNWNLSFGNVTIIGIKDKPKEIDLEWMDNIIKQDITKKYVLITHSLYNCDKFKQITFIQKLKIYIKSIIKLFYKIYDCDEDYNIKSYLEDSLYDYEKLNDYIKQYPQIFLTINGHFTNEEYCTSKGFPKQVLINYQLVNDGTLLTLNTNNFETKLIKIMNE